MLACTLSGELESGGDKVRLTGRFTADRTPRQVAGAVGDLIADVTPVGGSEVAWLAGGFDKLVARGWENWTTSATYELALDGTVIELRAQGKMIRSVSGSRADHALDDLSVSCPALLARVHDLALESARVIGQLAGDLSRAPHARPGPRIEAHWGIAFLWLGIGQPGKALAAFGDGLGLLSGGSPGLHAHGVDRAIVTMLAERLTVTGHREQAERLAVLLAG